MTTGESTRPGLLRTVRRAGYALRRRARPAPGALPAPAAEPPPLGEVPVEPTHIGRVFDEGVARARGRVRPGSGPAYDLVHQHLDPVHYLLQVPRLLDPGRSGDPVRHFLRNGEHARLDPDPNFSMERYLERCPHRAGRERNPYVQWLRDGKAAGEIADPTAGLEGMSGVLGLDPHEVVELMVERRTDLLERLRHGTLGEMFARAAEIEPLISQAWIETARMRLLPLSDEGHTAQVVAVHRCQEAVGFRRARLVFVTNRPRWGGGRRLEGHVAHALVSRGLDPADVVVVHTDESGQTPPGRFPDGTRELDLAGIVGDMLPEDADHVLVAFLRSLEADAIVNVNSRMLYRSMRLHGRALAASERLFLVFFCDEQGPFGQWQGYSLRFFYRAYDYVSGVITDSDHLARTLVDRYRLAPDDRKVRAVHAPVDPGIGVARRPVRADRRPQVFWAGRWDRQKRVDLVLDIARLLPEVDLRMWGEVVLGGTEPVGLPDNVRLEGPYAHFSELDLDDADVWLYTSAWDGVPSLLLEVAMTGVPLVGTLVGGTGEVLDPDGSWPIGAAEGAGAYAAAIRAVLADPDMARKRALALRQRLVEQRTADAFADDVAELLLAPGTEEDGR